MAKITLTSSLSFADAFESFIFYKTAQGVTDKTIQILNVSISIRIKRMQA